MNIYYLYFFLLYFWQGKTKLTTLIESYRVKYFFTILYNVLQIT